MDEFDRIPASFRAFVAARDIEDATTEEMLRRLVRGPHPEDVADVLSSETASVVRKRLDATRSARSTREPSGTSGSGSSDRSKRRPSYRYSFNRSLSRFAAAPAARK